MNTSLLDILKLVWPLILVQIGFQIYAIIDLVKRKKTRNLTPVIWGFIIVLGEVIGAAAYFIFGRNEE